MANTKKTTSNNTTTTSQKRSNTTIKQLEAQLEEQRKQIELLMNALQNKSSIAEVNNDDIGAEEEILVISLTPNKLNLVGDGGVVLFSFNDIYEEQYIDYASLKEIVRLNREMARNGRFYILDERVVNKLRLKNNYKNILTPEQLKKILSMDVNKAILLARQAGVKYVNFSEHSGHLYFSKDEYWANTYDWKNRPQKLDRTKEYINFTKEQTLQNFTFGCELDVDNNCQVIDWEDMI